MSAYVLGTRRPAMRDARARNVGYLFRNLRKFLRLRRSQVENDTVGFQANLRRHQFDPMLAYAQIAADIGKHAGDLVVGAKLKGSDLP